MRKFFSSAVAIAALVLASMQASANSQTYCEMLAKDFADTRTTDVDLWQKSYRNAFNDCMNQYTAVAPAAPPKKKLQKQAAAPLNESETATAVAAVVKPKPELEPGSEAWNEYCAAKYKSFNPDTGTYNSYNGKERRCVVTQ
ncbi:MAG: BA14K family protein [Aestuariivirga sp.]